MANARMLAAKANNTNIGSFIIMALVLGSCVANGEYLGGGRELTGNPTVFDITQFVAVGDGRTNTFKVRFLRFFL